MLVFSHGVCGICLAFQRPFLFKFTLPCVSAVLKKIYFHSSISTKGMYDHLFNHFYIYNVLTYMGKD